MGAIVTASISESDLFYIREKGISPSKIMQKAIKYQKEGVILDDEAALKEIERLKRALSVMQQELLKEKNEENGYYTH